MDDGGANIFESNKRCDDVEEATNIGSCRNEGRSTVSQMVVPDEEKDERCYHPECITLDFRVAVASAKPVATYSFGQPSAAKNPA